jgi:hypothetical protein
MVEEEAVEEGLVPVLKCREEQIALNVRTGEEIVLVGAGALFFLGRDARRKEPVEAERLALLRREAGPLVEERVLQDVFAHGAHRPVDLAGPWVGALLEGDHGRSIECPRVGGTVA